MVISHLGLTGVNAVKAAAEDSGREHDHVAIRRQVNVEKAVEVMMKEWTTVTLKLVLVRMAVFENIADKGVSF